LIESPECLEEFIREAGFVDIQVRRYEIDIGNWRGDTDPELVKAREDALTAYRGSFQTYGQ